VTKLFTADANWNYYRWWWWWWWWWWEHLYSSSNKKLSLMRWIRYLPEQKMSLESAGMLLLMVIVAHFQEVSSKRRDQRTRMHVRPQKITSSFLPWLALGKRRAGSASFKTNLAKTVCVSESQTAIHSTKKYYWMTQKVMLDLSDDVRRVWGFSPTTA